MSDTECDLFEAQNEVADRMNAFISNFKKAPKDRINPGYLSARDKGLTDIWNEFVENHKSIRTQFDSTKLSTEYYITSNMFEKVEEIYFSAAGLIAQKRIELIPPTTLQTAQASTSNVIPTPQVNLLTAAHQEADPPINPPQYIQIPRMNVPTFCGTYEEWTSFRDLFIAAVHENPTLQPVHKLQYLKSLLKGDAEILLKQTPITNENYEIAWRTLEERFDNKRALITLQLRKLFSQQPAKETASSIRQLLDNSRECVNALNLQNIDTSSWDCILIYIISHNIPASSLSLWEQSIPRNTLPTFNGLLHFLENRFRTLEFSFVPIQPPSHQGRSKPQTFHTANTSCRVCQGPSHPLRLCPKFLDMNISQRLDHISRSKLCKNCFAFSHQTLTCQSSGCCNTCGQRHHSLLHIAQPNQIGSTEPANETSSTLQEQSSMNEPGPSNLHTNSHITRPAGIATDSSILATALVKVAAFDGQEYSFRALLDNASQESFVSKRVVQFLGLKPYPTTMTVSGVGQSHAPKPLGQVHLTFGSHYDATFTMSLSAIVLPVITYNLPNQAVTVNPTLISNIQLADPTYGTPGDIDMLLSASVFAALTLPSIKKDNAASTVALHTKLGWVLYGEANNNATQSQRKCFHVTSDDVISSTLQDFWKIEEVSIGKIQSLDDLQCEKIFKQTHTRTNEGRYCVHLPFKNEELPMLGVSRNRAVSRLLQVERKLSTNPKLRDEYTNCLNEYIELGHMTPIIMSEEKHRVCLPNESFTQTSYYLPHHAVVKTDSTTTKVRVVFDASSKSLNGKSLNDSLLTGPVLQDTLFTLLLRWRSYCIVLKADIEKMYRQVLVNPIHQPYQCIVWRNNCNDPIQDFQLRTVTFGTAAAPYLAIKTLYQLADDEADQFPIGATTLRKDFYVDDLLSGADSVMQAIEKQQQVTEILRRGGFQIRKWSSNHESVTNQLDKESKEVGTNENSTLKTLGILWCPKNDQLSIRVTLCTDKVSTKRSLLSEVAKLFDPLGMIAPTIISIKIMLQRLWLAGLSWDDPLPNAIQSDWNEFAEQLPSIEQIRISRWLKIEETSEIEIHGFSDASEMAYAAAVYVRVLCSDLKWAIHLVAAKTKVAPIKQISLPRLELCAATLLSKLIVNVNASLKAHKIYAWTDSEIVLAWLQGHPNRWTTFVANRVSEIHNTLDAASWNHVASRDNPADCASRGILPHQLIQHPLWWHGPPWLENDENDWPKLHKREIVSTTLECKKTRSFLTVPVNDTITQILNNCSTHEKAVRVTALILRWHRSKTSFRGSLISFKELAVAGLKLIIHTQNTTFFEEISALENNQPIPKKSKINSLHPFLDANRILRVGGRLKNADIPYNSKHPIIIPRKSRLTELLVDETHDRTMHGGASLMLAHLRNQYWIIDPRNTIRNRIFKCNTCFRYSNPSLNQLMGDLPNPRVNVSPPFGHTGVDYAGPISIRLRRCPGRPLISKGYICLFVCLATKAIHLELVGDMSAASFLATLNRFISRRGVPSDIYSDNGTYFVRAAHDIEEDMTIVRKSHSAQAAKELLRQSIQWHFIPPSAPHFGGLWEAGIKSTKKHLKKIVGDGTLTYEEMATTLCQIESCLNSRPLSPISNDPDDFEILTPGHFLIGRPLLARPQPSVLQIPTNRLQYWQRIYKLTEQFWKQWKSEYLARLQQRPKWISETMNIQIGELVLLKEDNLPPSQWKMARIIDTHPGVDGLTRVVTLKTPTTTLKRPIVKICRLPSQ